VPEPQALALLHESAEPSTRASRHHLGCADQ